MRIVIPQTGPGKPLPKQEPEANKPTELIEPPKKTNQAKEEFDRDLLKQAHEYIRTSEILRSEINKDIQAGVGLSTILDKALKCIALMTGDMSFYRSNKQKLTERETR